MSSDIMSTDFGKNKNMLVARRYLVVDANDINDDRSLHIPTPSEKLISSELQIDIKTVNKSKPDLDTAKSSIDTKEDQTKGDNNKKIRQSILSDDNIIKDISLKNIPCKYLPFCSSL